MFTMKHEIFDTPYVALDEIEGPISIVAKGEGENFEHIVSFFRKGEPQDRHVCQGERVWIMNENGRTVASV